MARTHARTNRWPPELSINFFSCSFLFQRGLIWTSRLRHKHIPPHVTRLFFLISSGSYCKKKGKSISKCQHCPCLIVFQNTGFAGYKDRRQEAAEHTAISSPVINSSPFLVTVRRRKNPTMAEEVQQLTRAFSGLGGLGVDESTMVSVLSRWRKQPEKRSGFRKGFPGLFKSHGDLDRCEEEFMLHLAAEFARFKNLIVLWAMHPWERDARLVHHVLHQAHPAVIVVEVACTRSADELLGARRAYQALFHHSLEEDVAHRARDKPYCNLLVGLVSAYRYEGPRVNDDAARAEAKALGAAVKSAGGAAGKKLVAHDDVVRVLTTRSRPHLAETFKYYKEFHGRHIVEDLDGTDETLLEAALCLAAPAKYFAQVMEAGLRDGADSHAKDALTRVAVTRSDVDMDDIRAAYKEQFGAALEDVVAARAHGHYRDALLSLVGAAK